MAGTTNWPGALDVAAEAPANLNDTPTHEDLHEDLEARTVAMQMSLGVGVGNVAARLGAAAARQVVRVVPGAATDGGGGAWTDWLSLGSIVVPAGATRVIFDVAIQGYVATTTGLPLCLSRVVLQGQASDVNGRLDPATSTTDRRSTAFSASIDSPTAGTRTLTLQVQRQSGTGAIRADTGTLVTVGVSFAA